MIAVSVALLSVRLLRIAMLMTLLSLIDVHFIAHYIKKSCYLNCSKALLKPCIYSDGSRKDLQGTNRRLASSLNIYINALHLPHEEHFFTP